MSSRTGYFWLAVVGLALGLVVWWNLRPALALRGLDLVQGIGAGCANETLRVRNGAHRIVVVTSGADDPLLPSFRKVLRQQARIELIPHFVRPDPENPSACSPTDLRQILRQHATAGVMVFLLELPAWDVAESCFPQDTGPKLVALTRFPSPRHHEGYFQHGRMAALIAVRRTFDGSTPSAPKTPREWFAHDYQVITPEDYSTVLAGPGREAF